MTNDFALLDNISVTYYYGGFSVVDENITPMSEARDFPSPDISLFSKIYLITEGSYEAVFNGMPRTVKAGDFLLLPSGVEFKFGDSFKKFKQYWAHFNIPFLDDKKSDFLASFQTEYLYHVSSRADMKELQKIFNRLISAGNKDTLIAKFTTKAYLMYLVAYCLNSLKATDITSSASFVKSVTNYIYNNIQEHITLTDLADHFNMTKEHFIRTFKKETGLTPVQFILNKKFEIVRGLLNNTTLPISNIMFNVGFMDASSFSRAFKKYAGCSPSEYREKTPSSQSFEEEKARLKNSDPEEQDKSK